MKQAQEKDSVAEINLLLVYYLLPQINHCAAGDQRMIEQHSDWTKN